MKFQVTDRNIYFIFIGLIGTSNKVDNFVTSKSHYQTLFLFEKEKIFIFTPLNF